MLKAQLLEYRFRYALHALIYGLGFYAPWERYTSLPGTQSTTWLTLAAFPAREHWLSFADASQLILILGCCCTLAGAALRFWGASFLGGGVVQSPALHGVRVLAAGPYRHLRNPLYLGTFLNTLALALLMQPSGAVFTILAIALLQLRLIGAEQSFLTNTLGEPYRAYCARVPSLWPALRPRVPASPDRPNYLLGFASEIFVIGTAVSFLAVGYHYNSLLVIKGILIALGLSLIARAFIPNPPPESAGIAPALAPKP